MNKTENHATGVSNSDTPPFAIKPMLALHDTFKYGDPKSQKESTELVYFDHGLEVRMNRHDIELMGEELEEAEVEFNKRLLKRAKSISQLYRQAKENHVNGHEPG